MHVGKAIINHRMQTFIPFIVLWSIFSNFKDQFHIVLKSWLTFECDLYCIMVYGENLGINVYRVIRDL